MHGYILRSVESDLQHSFCANPVLAVPGPRQARKSTLGRHCLASHNNALILELGKRRLAFEFKASASPQLSKGFFSVLETLQPSHTWVGCQMDGEDYALQANVKVAGIGEALRDVRCAL